MLQTCKPKQGEWGEREGSEEGRAALQHCDSPAATASPGAAQRLGGCSAEVRRRLGGGSVEARRRLGWRIQGSSGARATELAIKKNRISSVSTEESTGDGEETPETFPPISFSPSLKVHSVGRLLLRTPRMDWWFHQSGTTQQAGSMVWDVAFQWHRRDSGSTRECSRVGGEGRKPLQKERDGQGSMKRCRVRTQYSHLGKKGNRKYILERTDVLTYRTCHFHEGKKKTRYTKWKEKR